jgi:hypothetical protein
MLKNGYAAKLKDETAIPNRLIDLMVSDGEMLAKRRKV